MWYKQTVPSAAGENAPKRSCDSISQEWASLAAFVSVIPIFFIVSHFADDTRALVAACSAGIIVLTVRYFWDLKRRIWFWTVITFIVFLHVLLVLFLPPPAKQWNYVHWNRVQMLPFALLDFGLAYSIVRLVETVMKKLESPSGSGDVVPPKTVN